MSAEGKKKRGESGVANAKHIPFRYSGGGVHPNHLARTMMAVGGLVDKCGRPRDGSAWDRPLAGLSYAEATAVEERARRPRAA